MAKPTLLAFCKLTPQQMDRLDQDFNVLLLYKEPDPEATLNAAKNDVKAIIAAIGSSIHANLINALPNLEIISLKSVGFDYVDLQAAKDNGVIVTNTPNAVTNDTADTAMALLLNTSRRYVELDAYVRVGKWMSVGTQPLSTSISGKHVGIAGLGSIGQAIAKRCEAFNMTISYYGRTKKDGFAYHYYDNLQDMASDVDYLIMAVPGGTDTKHLVNMEVLRALGSKGYLINISRGSVVDEQALIEALHNGVIAGAGMDVYADEPNVPNELKSMDNVVLFPHVGGFTHEAMHHMGEIILENLALHFAGKPVKTPVQL